jgi:hypothetical protein
VATPRRIIPHVEWSFKMNIKVEQFFLDVKPLPSLCFMSTLGRSKASHQVIKSASVRSYLIASYGSAASCCSIRLKAPSVWTSSRMWQSKKFNISRLAHMASVSLRLTNESWPAFERLPGPGGTVQVYKMTGTSRNCTYLMKRLKRVTLLQQSCSSS